MNEHFADVFGSLIKQWKKKQTAAKADWLIGPDIMGPETTAKSLRTFKAGLAYENDPNLGTDPQPKHLKNKYTGSHPTPEASTSTPVFPTTLFSSCDRAWRQCMAEGGPDLVRHAARSESDERFRADGGNDHADRSHAVWPRQRRGESGHQGVAGCRVLTV